MGGGGGGGEGYLPIVSRDYCQDETEPHPLSELSRNMRENTIVILLFSTFVISLV